MRQALPILRWLSKSRVSGEACSHLAVAAGYPAGLWSIWKPALFPVRIRLIDEKLLYMAWNHTELASFRVCSLHQWKTVQR